MKKQIWETKKQVLGETRPSLLTLSPSLSHSILVPEWLIITIPSILSLHLSERLGPSVSLFSFGVKMISDQKSPKSLTTATHPSLTGDLDNPPDNALALRPRGFLLLLLEHLLLRDHGLSSNSCEMLGSSFPAPRAYRVRAGALWGRIFSHFCGPVSPWHSSGTSGKFSP